ncbi:MAG TPA: N-acetyltransferase [Bacteroidetes bacterium]|nr:acetyltransferase Pat [bacterium BMS3Bbin03]HDK35923.1 N-acetyltransferase [Bacteroidota bacterium]
MFKDYPKEKRLKGGTKVMLRPMEKKDEKALYEFFNGLKPGDRLFLKDDVTDQRVIHEWVEDIDYEKIIPILAFDGEKVIGDATLHRSEHGWSRHVGEIRMVTASGYRRRGLGLVLAKEIFLLAQLLGIEKVQAEMMDSQQGAIKVFETIGFQKEAVLNDYVKDLQGRKHNLVIMTQDISRLWERMDKMLLDMEDHGG